MYSNPLDLLLKDLGEQVSGEHTDIVFGTTDGRYEIKPSGFIPIVLDSEPRRTAFVDGGNGLLVEAPSYLISLNQVCYVLFEGECKLPPAVDMISDIRFFSCVVPRVRANHEIVYDTRIYAEDFEAVSEYLPDPDDLLASRDREATVLKGSSPLASLARRLAEIQLATKVVRDEMDTGDMLVLDGSLQTSFAVEKKYADILYRTAEEKKVIVCGLAKTTRLLTESGDPLMARVSEIAQNVEHQRWYVPIAERITEDGQGFLLAVKLHPNSRFVYRLEILRSQYLEMSDKERGAVLCSLALNSRDVAIPGYPYGAVVADRDAQVRKHESAMYKRLLVSRGRAVPAWRRLAAHSASVTAHDTLNKVTG